MSKYNYTSCILISLLTILVLATIIIRGIEPLNDGDIWFHLAYGRYLLENHTLIPDHSVFSWTPAENGTIYCAWLSEIIFYLLYKTGGLTMLYVFRYLVIIIFIVLAFSLLKKNLIELSPVTLLILLTGLLMSYAGLRIKAELFSFLFMTILVWCWFTIKDHPDNNWCLLYVFPVIFLMWVNSHGGFVFGLVFMTLIAAGELLNFITGSPSMLKSKFRKHLLISFCMCFISIFLTPYGFHYPVQLVNNLILNPEEFSSHTKTIAEYQSIFFPQASYLHFKDYLLVAITILFISLVVQIKRQKPYWEILLINAGFILLYVKFLRATYFWGILFVFSSIFLLNKISQDGMKVFNNKLIRYATYSIAGIVLIFFVLRNQYQMLAMPSMGIHQDYIIPVSEAEYIRETYPVNIVGNDYYCGSYLMWSLWPTKKVFIDSRYFPYRRWYTQNNEFEINTDRKYNDLFLKKHQSDIWMISYDTPVLNYFISSPEWRLVYYGSSACVFISRGIQFHQQKHLVSDSVYKTGIYQAYKILRLAGSVGDIDTAVRIVRTMQPNPISVLQENIAMNAMLFVGSRLSEIGRHRDAIELYAGALEISKRYRWLKMIPGRKDNKYLPLLHDSLGYSLMKVNRIPEAVTEYNYALKLNPGATHAQRYLPLLTEQLKKIDTVLDKLKVDLINSPNDLKLLNTLAMLSAMRARYDEAQLYLLRALKINPKDPNIYYNIACLYSKQKRIDDSVNYLKQAVNKGFKDWNTLHNDPDLDNIRNTKYFTELESYR